MYRDFFDFVPPGIVYLNAAVLAAFGRRAAVVALLHVALGCALAVAVHAAASRLIASRWRFLAPAAFLAVVYLAYSPGNHKWPALLCGLLAVNALMAGTGAARAVTAGALLGASALFTPDIGLGMTAGAAAGVRAGGAPGATRRALLVVAGSAAAFGAVAGAFALMAGPRTIVHDWVIFPLTFYRAKNALFVGLASHHGPRTAAQAILVVAGIAGAVVMARRGDGPQRVLAWAGLGLVLATAHRPWTPLLLAVRCAPLIVPAVWMLQRGLARRGFSRALVAAALGVLVAATAWGVVSIPGRRQWLDPLVRQECRAGAVWLPAARPELRWIEEHVPEGGALFALPHMGGVHFLTRTRAVT